MKNLTQLLADETYIHNLVENKQIDTEDELYDYARAILKKAHGDEYDEDQMKKMVKNLLKKHDDGPDNDGNYDEIVGILQNSVSESIMEVLAVNPSGGLSDPLLLTEPFEHFLHLCAIAQGFAELSTEWHKLNTDTLTSAAISDEIVAMDEIADKAFMLATYGAVEDTKIDIDVRFTDDDLIGKRLMPLIKRFDEWKEFVSLNKKVTDDLADKSMNMQLRALIMIFLDHSARLIDIVQDKKAPGIGN